MTAAVMAPPARSPAVDPAPARTTIDDIAAAVRRLPGLVGDVTAWPAEERRTALRRLDQAVDGLAALRAVVLLAERESGAWRGGGHRSFEAWRARTGLAGERATASQVRQAEHLAAVPTVAAAVTEGRIGLEHAATIGRVAATGTPAQRAAVVSARGQAHLMQIAQHQDAGTFATTVAGFVAGVDPEGLESEHQAQRRARFLHLSHTPRGTLIKGRLDSVAGHRLQLALEASSPRPGADDDRDPGQRRADALDAMAGRILSDPDTKPGAHVPPHVSMILTEATWNGARAELRRRRAAGWVGRPGSDRGSDPSADSAGGAPRAYEPATLEDGTPVAPTELAVAMCDCDVTRIVVDAEGAPLDLGRTQRLFAGPQRRAVIARDRGCIWPACHAPARWCEIHHTDWWDRDEGYTRVDRGVLLCTFHHHEVHRRDVSVTRVSADRARRRAPNDVRVRVRYELRDAAGRLIGEPAHAQRAGPESPSPPAPERATDPMTGMSVPAFFPVGEAPGG